MNTYKGRCATEERLHVVLDKVKEEKKRADKIYGDWAEERNKYKAENTRLKIALRLAIEGDGTPFSAIPQTRETLRKCKEALGEPL